MLIYQGTPVREQFDIVDDKVYLRAANICPCATSVAAAVDDFVNVWRREGDACWGLVESAFEEGKALFAKLIGADSGEIATIENTSMGLSIAASLIAPPPGSNVVVDELTHQSNVYPWMLRSPTWHTRTERISSSTPHSRLGSYPSTSAKPASTSYAARHSSGFGVLWAPVSSTCARICSSLDRPRWWVG